MDKGCSQWPGWWHTVLCVNVLDVHSSAKDSIRFLTACLAHPVKLKSSNKMDCCTKDAEPLDDSPARLCKTCHLLNI